MIFEWLPRSPGLYFTPRAAIARKEARRRIVEQCSDGIVYHPAGKQSMLDGGVGTIRLMPLELPSGEWFFMSASDSGACHQAFPVALPRDIYLSCIDEIRTKGATVRTLIGELKSIPQPLRDLYYGYTRVHQLYLQVSEIRSPNSRKSLELEDLDVSVAITFDGKVDGVSGIYASYCTFHPGRDDELNRAVEWLGNYAARYQGTVLTDFDQTRNSYPTARFSLAKVMKFDVNGQDLESVIRRVNGAEKVVLIQNCLKQYIVNGGNIAAFGDYAQAHDFRQL